MYADQWLKVSGNYCSKINPAIKERSILRIFKQIKRLFFAQFLIQGLDFYSLV